MAFHVPAPNPLQTESLRHDVNQLVRVGPNAAQRPVVAVGQILDVMVSDNGKMQLGVTIQGQFYPAFLPKGYQPGDRLKVKVQSNEDALVLKILMSGKDPAQITNASIPPRASLSQLFSLLLPEQQQADLSRAAKLLHRDPTDSVPPEARAVGGKARDVLPQQIKEALQRLQRDASLLELHDNPHTPDVARVITQFSTQSVLRGLTEARRALDSISIGDSRPTAQTPIIRTLIPHLERLLESSLDLGFRTQPTPAADLPDPSGLLGQRIGMNLQLTSALSRYAIQSSDAALLTRVREALTGGLTQQHPLLLLSPLLLGSLEATSSAPTEGDGETVRFVQQILSHIERLSREGADNERVRTQIATLLSAAQSLRGQVGAKEREELGASLGKKLTQQIEALLAGQEALHQVNPLLQSLGEPSMLMIPVLIGGIVTPLEVLLRPPYVESDHESQRRQKAQSQYTRVDLHLTLPRLGRLSAALAFRGQEILLHIGAENRATAELIASRQGDLEVLLKARGFTDVSIRVTEDTPHSPIVPRVLTDRSGVVVA